MILKILFVACVILMIVSLMFMFFYDPKTKTLDKVDIDVFVVAFCLITAFSVIATLAIFAEPLIMLSVVVIISSVFGTGVAMYRGMNRLRIFLDKRNKKWVAMIYIKDKLKQLGRFETELEASQYYENALKAHLNNEEIIVKLPNFTSKYKGVSWSKRDKKWRARIFLNKQEINLGYFTKELEANEAYQKALLEI